MATSLVVSESIYIPPPHQAIWTITPILGSGQFMHAHVVPLESEPAKLG